MSGEEWSELHFDDCRIPAENVLLGPGGSSSRSRLSTSSARQLGGSLALGRYAYERAREHALTREQFGRPLCEFQGLQWKFAEMRSSSMPPSSCSIAPHHADRGLPSAYETARREGGLHQAGFEVATTQFRQWARSLFEARRWWNIACGAAAAG